MRLIFLALLLTSCAETRLYEKGKDGKTHLIAEFQSDASSIQYDHGQTHFKAATLNNSNPTASGGQSVNAIETGIGSAAVAIGIPALF